MGGVRVKTSRVLEKGLEYDRRWMLIDKHNNFLTQRVYPVMALFKMKMQDDGFLVLHGQDSILLPFTNGHTDKSITASIWDDKVEVYEVSDLLSHWFSERLGMDCKLVFFPENNLRPVDPKYSLNHEQVSLADAYPFLIIGEQSLRDLNSRLEEPLPMNRFRPNFVFRGGQPYEEDQWRKFSIGKSKFERVKSCARCVMTTVNQETGERGIEPLAALAKYRKKENKVLFGQNLIALDNEIIREDDFITLSFE